MDSRHIFSHATVAQSGGTAFSGPCFRLTRRLAHRLLVASGSSEQRRRMMRVLMRSAAAILLIAAGFLFVPAASAQVQSPSPGLPEQSPNIPDQKLDAAAAAIERVASLKQDYQQRIAAAAPADKERILNEAVNALEKAVTDQGLSVEEYDSILEVAQNDPDVREKIRQRIRPSAQ
jgi:predicted TIM-barrel fold metal-dependent hydrolase